MLRPRPDRSSAGDLTRRTMKRWPRGALAGSRSRVLEVIAAIANVEVVVGQADIRLDVRVGVLFDQVRLGAGSGRKSPLLDPHREIGLLVDVQPRAVELELAARDGVRAL